MTDRTEGEDALTHQYLIYLYSMEIRYFIMLTDAVDIAS